MSEKDAAKLLNKLRRLPENRTAHRVEKFVQIQWVSQVFVLNLKRLYVLNAKVHIKVFRIVSNITA